MQPIQHAHITESPLVQPLQAQTTQPSVLLMADTVSMEQNKQVLIYFPTLLHPEEDPALREVNLNTAQESALTMISTPQLCNTVTRRGTMITDS